MSISINQFKTGLTILIDNDIYSVVDFQHVKPGKGAAFVRTRLKNLKTDALIERTFRGDEKIEEAFLEQKKMQYLYKSADTYNFMDNQTYEQLSLSQEHLGQKAKFLKDNLEVIKYFHNAELISIDLPTFINLEVKHTEPGIRGDTAKSGTKPAELETGVIIAVPLFIEVGDVIKVDTRTGTYVERA